MAQLLNFLRSPTLLASVYRVAGAAIAIFLWWVPLGLHRIWMRQKFWWLHPLAFAFATLAGNHFFSLPKNIELVENAYQQTGQYPRLGQYEGKWLLIFTLVWLALVIHDIWKIWTWPVPLKTK